MKKNPKFAKYYDVVELYNSLKGTLVHDYSEYGFPDGFEIELQGNNQDVLTIKRSDIKEIIWSENEVS